MKIHAQVLEQLFDYEEIDFPGTDEFATQGGANIVTVDRALAARESR